jgi:hypothetical protein
MGRTPAVLGLVAALATTVACGAGPSDALLARRVLLRSSDLGRGWTRGPMPEIDQCSTGRSSPSRRAAVSFVSASLAARAENAVGVYSSGRKAHVAFGRALRPSFLACIRRVEAPAIRRQGGRIVTLGRLRFARAGGESVAYRMRVRFRGGVSMYGDFVYIRRERTVIGLVFERTGEPLAREAAIAARLARRAA